MFYDKNLKNAENVQDKKECENKKTTKNQLSSN